MFGLDGRFPNALDIVPQIGNFFVDDLQRSASDQVEDVTHTADLQIGKVGAVGCPGSKFLKHRVVIAGIIPNDSNYLKNITIITKLSQNQYTPKKELPYLVS